MRHTFLVLAGLFVMSASVLAQPLPTMPPPGYDQGGQYPSGTITSVSYYSPSQSANDTMYVYLPPGYTTAKKYPVIYGYPGIGAGADTIFAGWCVDAGGLADNLIGQGKIQPVIIVAIDDNNGDVQSDTLNVIVPYIDSHYSTYADADHRGLYGYSWGGGYTFNVGCGNLNTFHYLSPSSAAPDKSGDDVLFPNGGAEAKQKLKTLLISCGNADYLGLYGPSEGAHNYCGANGIPHAWWPVKNGNHDAGVWRPAMWNFLQMADAAGFRYPPRPRSAYSRVAAVDYDTQKGGVVPETCSEGGRDVGSIQNGYYLTYNNVDFANGAVSFQARVASATSGGNIEIRVDGTNGTLLGTCAVAGTGGWQTWTTKSVTVSGVSGIHQLYLKFTGSSGYLFNINWWQFNCANLPTPPAAAASLLAKAGVEQSVLSWPASASATTYNIKRATTSGGAFTTIANVAGTNYIDRGVIGGTIQYYVVSALNVGGESADSVETSVTPSVSLPSPWLTRDIGAVGLPGGASFTNGIFTVTGSGAEISGTSDAFRFVHLATNGDCTIVARVASLDDYISSWSKAGVMIRESLATNAVNAFIAVTPGNGVIFQCRSSAGAAISSNYVTGITAPCWVKLVRAGNTFTGYRSSNGSSWTQVGSATISMASASFTGLAVTSHNFDTLCTATFDRVTGPGWVPPAAPTPTGLTATAGIEQVALKWNPSANATSYNLKRGTVSGACSIIANVTSTNYTDPGLVGRTKYYYVVSAVNSLAGESDNSTQVDATPTSNVPLPWMTQDIGATGVWGNAGITNGVFTVNGSGEDIWGSADAFRFVYITNTSDCTVIARVVSLSYSDGWAKAGIMARDSLDPGAANAFICVTPGTAAAPGNGAAWQYRSSDGGICNNTTMSASAPCWIKLVRSGNRYTGYCSPNGSTWSQVGSVTLTNISSTPYIGLAVSAHNNSSLCTAKFDNVSLPGWPPPLLTVDAVAASSTQVGVSWNKLTNATSYNIKRSFVSGGPYALLADGVNGTNYIDYVASVRARYYYVVSAIVGGKETTNSPEAALRYPGLTGRVIGTAGSWNNSGDTIDKVFDGDFNSFFDAPDPGNGDWVGLDFGPGVSNVVTRIRYCPRSGFESRMVGGIFQGANQANFSDAVPLGSVRTAPPAAMFTLMNVANTGAFRYVRYLAPNGTWGNVAELEFSGYLFSPPIPPVMGASFSGADLTFNWPMTSPGFTLQSCTNLFLGEWIDAGAPTPQLVSNQWQIVLPPPTDGASIFYRLVK